MDSCGPQANWQDRLAGLDPSSLGTAEWLLRQLPAPQRETLLVSLQNESDPLVSLWPACDGVLTVDQRMALDCVACFPDGSILSDWLLDLLRQFKALPPLSGIAAGGAEVDLLDDLINANLLRALDESAERVGLGASHAAWRLAQVESQPARNKIVSNAILLYLRNRARPTAKNKARPYRPRELPELASLLRHVAADGAPLTGLQIANGVAPTVRKQLGAAAAEQMLAPLVNPPLLQSDDEARITHVVGLEHLSYALRDQKRFADSEAAIDRAISILRRLRGPEGLGMGMLIHAKALLASDRFRFAEAESLMWQAMAMRRKFIPDDHLSFSAHHSVLALILQRQRKLPAAVEQAERALAIAQRNNVSEEELAGDFATLAALRRQAGMSEAALQAIDESLALCDIALRPDDPKVLGRRLIRAKILAQLKRRDQAKAAYEQLLEIDPPDETKPLVRHSTTYNDLAVLCLALGDLTTAEAHMRRAIAIREQIPDVTLIERLKPLQNLLAIQKRRGDSVGMAETQRQIAPISEQLKAEARQRVRAAIERGKANRLAAEAADALDESEDRGD